ncbi:UvrD-helicase domain-containing protein [Myxococcus xanthus]|uniref:DNA 3'-5' helicase n=1 Tax=Myxococcus xanthus TaxID=34 RepID=A0A7Y4IQ93_MYXXA|nr:UvrD-helicase domain-containing protein [Myxococcus xanthus]NOJ83329.1 AAA family ATPase [Myxococcus xanthus]NOJ88181.1 AAA family ATPase [Myxococcus xanthus]
MPSVELAISRELLLQLPRLPHKVQRKVYELVENFEQDSRSAARHLESIHDFKDKRARTARVGDDYRAIIIAPDTGNRFLLVYVDHHDEAMRWARNKVFDVHPVVGSLQVVDVAAAAAAVEQLPAGREPGAFDKLKDPQLVELGIPEVLLPSVRRVRDEASLRKLAPHLPEEAAEALTWLLHGDSFEEVRAAVGRPERKVDVDDLGAALEEPSTQRRFVQVRSAVALEELLSRDVEAWRVFLHPDQRKLVSHSFNGPARVLGGPGTGKTVVAMHRARYLAEQVWTAPHHRILFTTFSQNLARDLRRNLRKLCNGNDPPRIEVTHLHAWAAGWLRERGVKLQIAQEEQVREAWAEATGVTGLSRFTLAFVQQEWERVVQAQDIQTETAYLRASRRGRGGTPLKKEDRQFLWSVFTAYREALQSRQLHEFVDVVRLARKRLEEERAFPYQAVVVDETQDLGLEELKLLRTLAPTGANDLFLVGDAHQRLYAPPVRVSSAGIDIRGRGKTLKINYRTTHEIRGYAVRLFGEQRRDDLDGGEESLKGYSSVLSGPEPKEVWFADQGSELQAVVQHLRTLLKDAPAESVGLLVRTRELARQYEARLKEAGLPVMLVHEKSELDEGPGIRVCTLHRAKGLEFHHVLLCGLGDERFPLPVRPELLDDELAVEEHQARERNLLFVGATRARETLWLSGWGRHSPL